MVCDGITGGGTPGREINGVKIMGGIREAKDHIMHTPNGDKNVGTDVTLDNGVSIFLSNDSQSVAANKNSRASIWVNDTNDNSTSTSFSRIKGFRVDGTPQKDKMEFKGCDTEGRTIDVQQDYKNIDNDEITVKNSAYHGVNYESNITLSANHGDIVNGKTVTAPGQNFSNTPGLGYGDAMPEYKPDDTPMTK